jgi:hypothetical protein
MLQEAGETLGEGIFFFGCRTRYQANALASYLSILIFAGNS